MKCTHRNAREPIYADSSGRVGLATVTIIGWRCLGCRDWLPMGCADDSPPEVEIEIELASHLAENWQLFDDAGDREDQDEAEIDSALDALAEMHTKVDP